MDFPQTYKHVRLKGGIVQLVDEPFPQQMAEEPNAVIIKLVYMGICRTDIKEVQSSTNTQDERGALFGHEFFGQVEYAGIDTDIYEGQYVTLNPNITPDRSTGFGEYFFITGDKVLLQKALIPIEKELIDPLWMPEPFACVIHSIDVLLDLLMWEDFTDKSVAVIGAGNSGIISGLCIKYLNGRVKLFNRGSERLNFIKTRQFFAENEVGLLPEIDNEADKYDVVIAVPSIIDTDILAKSFKLVKNNGSIHLYGSTKSGDKFMDSTIDIDIIRQKEQKVSVDYQGKMFTLTGAYGCNDEDFYEAISLYDEENESFPLQQLITKTVTLSEFPALMASLAAGQADQPGKILVIPDAQIEEAEELEESEEQLPQPTTENPELTNEQTEIPEQASADEQLVTNEQGNVPEQSTVDELSKTPQQANPTNS